MFRRDHVLGVLLAVAAVASPAWAQRSAPRAAPQADDWTHGTTVSLSGGVARAASESGAMLGGAVGWELRPRLAIEGSGVWLDRGGSGDGFGAALNVRAGLVRTGVSPFVEGGFGLYRLMPQDRSSLPAFYRRRIGAETGLLKPFTDPMFHLGAGISVFISRKVALQPAVEAMIVTRGGHAYTIAAAALRVAYHFEDHPVTLSR